MSSRQDSTWEKQLTADDLVLLQKVKLFVWNINCDRRTKQKPYSDAYPGCSMENRLSLLCEEVQCYLSNGHICALFEITVDVLAHLYSHFKSWSLDVEIVKGIYCQSPGSFCYLILIPNSYKLLKSANLALTSDFTFCDEATRPKTDEEKKNNKEYMAHTLDEFFEKAFMHLHLEKHGRQLHLIVTHLGLRMNARMKETAKLLEWVTKNIPEKEQLAICGDFNAFDEITNGPYYEQMQLFTKSGFDNLVPFEINTFVPYAYDIFFKLANKEDKDKYTMLTKLQNPTAEQIAEFKNLCDTAEKKEMPSKALDNVFVKGICGPNVHVKVHWSSSDHAALVATL